jgi:galactokinase
MVQLAQNQPGCYGARMTGGGFGGCAVALVKAEAADHFAKTVAHQYQSAASRKPSVYICRPSNGAEKIEEKI